MLNGCTKIKQEVVDYNKINKIEFSSYYHCITGKGVMAEDCTKAKPLDITDESVEAYLKNFEPGGWGEDFYLTDEDNRKKLRSYMRQVLSESELPKQGCDIYMMGDSNESSSTDMEVENFCKTQSFDIIKFHTKIISVLDKYDQ